ncbi:MAG TPA: PEP/pyruvate-binding domain-containing protein [candidate division Zixibacteria bacterium]|nr:PEP/pyruvate-binding domain-containing protein [candidate division Zixibacteria bacterium]
MSDKPIIHEVNPLNRKFDDLMQFRVKHVLLVSSPYDSYVLEEDGMITDLIYNEFLELNLTVSPHVRRADNAEQALKIIKEQDIDLVIVFKRVSDIDVIQFGLQVKQINPKMPVVLLAYHQRELTIMEDPGYHNAIDHVFIWTGDVRIMLSIIKLIEDKRNIDADTALIGVRVIIVVEDNVKFYSSFLPLLYTGIMQQTHALMEEGMNISDKMLRMRTRPKILLATDFEQGCEIFDRYEDFTLAVISDVRYKVGGVKDNEAGIKLAKRVRARVPDMPILLQSSDLDNAKLAFANDVGFIFKRSPTLHQDIRRFITSYFGFGDFVFTLPDGTEVAKAADFQEMEAVLANVDERALLFHAGRNHFSNWLMARTEFDLARRLRPKKASEFKSSTELRRYLINTFKNFRHERQLGVVSDFSRRRFDLQSDFVRVGGGSLGGKGRGLAFVNALLSQRDHSGMFDNVRIKVPRSVIIGTDIFDAFVDTNDLVSCALGIYSDEEITDKFLKAKFPRPIKSDLRALLEVVKHPLAVRSSSMLEDSHLEPAAGVYDTHMLPNCHEDPKIRLRQLVRAIKLTWASTFFSNARVYHESVGNRVEEEKMAVIVQQAIGLQHEETFYPSFSGVALSYNYYSTEGILPEDGVIYTALGLGKTIVDGMNCLRFSPTYPERLPQFATTKDMLRNSQRAFYAIDLANSRVMPEPGGEKGLIRLDLDDAERHGTLTSIASTYVAENDRVYDGVGREGTRIISFAPILKHHRFPLPEIARYLLNLGSHGLNCPVEIEFAVKLSDDKSKPDDFYFLQVRPMVKDAVFETVSLDDVDRSRVIGKSDNALGNMRLTAISDILLVDPDKFDRGKTVEIAEQVGQFNSVLKEAGHPYLLLGPGRWGTSERWLGVPANWNQISGAKVIIEAAYGDFAPDPSFGTHFFQNLISMQVGYMTINPTAGNGFLDWPWLMEQRVEASSDFVRHIVLEKPMEILIDGRAGGGLLLKPEQ